MKKLQFVIVALIVTSSTLMIATTTLDKAAAAYLKIKQPDNNQKVAANRDFLASGTSVPSNETRTKCSVQLQIDQHGYNQTTPKGIGNAPYEVWTKLIPAKEITPGTHSVEAQFLCLAPGGNVNFIKHLVHNLTALNGPIPVLPPTSAEIGQPPPMLSK